MQLCLKTFSYLTASLPHKHFKIYVQNFSRFSISADGHYLMLQRNVRSVFRRSSLSEYVVRPLKKAHKYVEIKIRPQQQQQQEDEDAESRRGGPVFLRCVTDVDVVVADDDNVVVVVVVVVVVIVVFVSAASAVAASVFAVAVAAHYDDNVPQLF